MALPKTDTFTAADATTISSYNSNYKLNSGNARIYSNCFCPYEGSTESGIHWQGDTFGNDQYSTATLKGTAAGVAVGVGVRHAADTTNSYYGLYSDPNNCYAFKVVTGTWTQFGSSGTAWSVNDVVKIEVSGSTLSYYKNGSLDTSVATSGQKTDSALTSGYAGLTGYDSSSSCRIDDWEGGDLGGGAGVGIPLVMNDQRMRRVA